jgi:glycosyltransferase involved in cell wall biosynthesis
MKILYLSGAPRVSTHSKGNSTGARAHILGIINGFKTKGWIVDQFIFGDVIQKGKQIKDRQKQLADSLVKRIIADLIRLFFNEINSRRISHKYTVPDLVYERVGAFQSLGKFISKKGCIWIAETNSILFEEASKDRKSVFFTGICRRIELNTYRKADFIVCITEELKQLLIEKLNIEPKKIIVIPNGVDITRFDPENITPKKFFDSFTIGFIGTLIDWCGLDLLIETVAQFPFDNRPNLTIVGDGISREKFEKKVTELGITSHVRFLGQQPWDEIPSYIAGFDVCYSGQIETKSGKMYHSPLKIYEYLAMGKPVIASSYADAKNTIIDGFNGYLFTPGDKVELTKAIFQVKLYHQNKEFNYKKIHAKIVEEHSWDSRVKDLLNKIGIKE